MRRNKRLLLLIGALVIICLLFIPLSRFLMKTVDKAGEVAGSKAVKNWNNEAAAAIESAKQMSDEELAAAREEIKARSKALDKSLQSSGWGK